MENKGKKNGLCNRKDCLSPHNVIYYNISTRAYYCPSCARKLNDWSMRDHMKMICRTDEDWAAVELALTQLKTLLKDA